MISALPFLIKIVIRVSLQLCAPEFTVRFWNVRYLTVCVPMPKAAVNKNDSLILRKDNVRMSFISLVIHPKAKSSREKIFPDLDFDSCVFRTD